MADGIIHIDIPVKDLEATPEFYAKVFGWELTPMPEQDYVLFTADGGGISGGFAKLGGFHHRINLKAKSGRLNRIIQKGLTFERSEIYF